MARFLIFQGASMVLFVVGCGSGTGGAGAGHGTAAVDEHGNVVTTASGTAVSSEAHDRWAAAIAKFNRFESDGWNADKCSEAIDAFEEAFDAQRSFAEAYYMAGLSASKCHDDARVLSFYNRALEANPRFCKALAAVGLSHVEAGRTDQGAQMFERAIREDARCTEAYVNLAMVQARRGGPAVAEAISNLRRALAIESSYLPAFNQMALIYLAQGERSAQSLDLAGVVCRQAQQINRDYAPIYNTWGLVNLKKGDLIEALRMFHRARTLDNTLYEAHMNFGQITLSFRGYEDAQNAFARAVELRPRSYDAQIGLGAALRGLNHPDEAKAHYDAAIQIDGARPEAYFNLGVLYQDYMSGSIEDMNRGKGHFEQFVSRAGENPAFRSQVQDVQRQCQLQQQPSGRRQRRSSRDCRPGRLQNITTAVQALTAAAAIQQQAGGGAAQ